MVFTMDNNMYLMDIDNSRIYVDDLFSDDLNKCREALGLLKDAVIGNNTQKGNVIEQGLLNRIMKLIIHPDSPMDIRCEAAIILRSLTKGTESQVDKIIRTGTIPTLFNIIMDASTSPDLIEILLASLRSLFLYVKNPFDVLNINILSFLINLAGPNSSIQCQESVIRLIPASRLYEDQMVLCQAGIIQFCIRLTASEVLSLQLPALECLSNMCFTNHAVCNILSTAKHEDKLFVDILTMLLSRARPTQIQLVAAKCLSYMQRADAIKETDERIVYYAIPCLARLCIPEYDDETRTIAADTLAYLTEIKCELQQLAAISNSLMISLSYLLQNNHPSPRQAAFRCFASLGANDEDIRKKIIDTDGLMDKLLLGIKDPIPEVQLAAVRCLHSLSRSVQQLRTTFRDHSVWMPLMEVFNNDPSNEMLTVVSSTICNLLLEFSPAKEPMIQSGAVELLCKLTDKEDPDLRLNGTWGLMNMAFQADKNLKVQIITALGTDRLFNLLNDADKRVIMKALGLVRNLLSCYADIEYIMTTHSAEMLHAINVILNADHPAEIKEQALCIIRNVASGCGSNDYIMQDDELIKKLIEFLNDKEQKLQEGAIFAFTALVKSSDYNKELRHNKLKQFGLLEKLQMCLDNNLESSVNFYEEITKLIESLQS